MLPVFLCKSFDSEGHLLCWQLCGRWILPPACTCGNGIHMGSNKHTLLLVLLEGTAAEGKAANPSQADFHGLCCECESCHWSCCLLLAGCSGKVASDRPSGQRCPSVSHSTGIFSWKHKGNGKAADHTINQITEFATEKHSECKCIHTSRLWLRADKGRL